MYCGITPIVERLSSPDASDLGLLRCRAGCSYRSCWGVAQLLNIPYLWYLHVLS